MKKESNCSSNSRFDAKELANIIMSTVSECFYEKRGGELVVESKSDLLQKVQKSFENFKRTGLATGSKSVFVRSKMYDLLSERLLSYLDKDVYRDGLM